MAKKPNYDYEKRKKELERKTKKEAKLARKRENAANRVEGDPDAEVPDESVEAETAE